VLHFAAAAGHEAVVGLLLKHKADVNAKNNNGWMALHKAAVSGHETVVQLLLEYKADVDVMAAQFAIGNGHKVVARLLMEHLVAVNGLEAVLRLLESARRNL
jgi:ankyrin repeat protein